MNESHGQRLEQLLRYKFKNPSQAAAPLGVGQTTVSVWTRKARFRDHWFWKYRDAFEDAGLNIDYVRDPSEPATMLEKLRQQIQQLEQQTI